MQASMDYGKAFTYPQQDAEWIKKFAILGVIILVGLLGSFVLLIPLIVAGLLVGGYTLEITRRVITDHPQPLPEWADFGDLFKKGAMVLVVALIYYLPGILFSFCGNLPSIMRTMANSGTLDPDTVRNLNNMLTSFSFVSLCCGCLAFLYSIAVGIIYPAALARLAVTGEIGAAFRFNEVIALVRAQPAVYVIVFLLSAVILLLAAIAGFIVCGIGIAFTAAYAALVNAHLVGQAYRAASGVSNTGATSTATA